MTRTITLTPTWADVLPILLAAIESGTDTGYKAAKQELQRMAGLADEANRRIPELAKALRLCLQNSELRREAGVESGPMIDREIQTARAALAGMEA